MSRGAYVGSLIFFIAAFITLLGAAFMFAGQENSKASEANKKAESALKHIEAMDNYVKTLEAKIKDLTDNINKLVQAIGVKTVESSVEMDAHKKKIEWLEMKANNQPRPSGHNRVTLVQEKPLQINVLYREAKGPLRPRVMSDPQIKAKVIEKVKKQLNELSQ